MNCFPAMAGSKPAIAGFLLEFIAPD